MAASKAVWGVDLGQCALKAIKLQPGGEGVEVVDYVHIEHPKILSQPDVDRGALVEAAMKQFLDRHDLSKDQLVVGVPGQHTLARFSKLPPVDKKKIPGLVQYEAQQQIPFDMDEVIWDYQIFSSGEGIEVGIFAMRRELLRNHLHFVADFNLEPKAVQSGPLALYNALKYDGLIGDEAIAILDIGTQNADLIVADGDSLWTRNIPIGGNAFTEALSKTFKVSFRKAENLKRDAAKSKYARQIFQAMRPVFADLVAEVQRSIGFFTSSRRGVRLNKVLAMGSAFKLPGLQKFLQQNLGMEIVRPPSFSKLDVSNAPNAPQLIDQMMSFGVAYGLALQGLELSTITSNLLPPEIAKQVIWRKKMPWFYGAVACLVLSSCIVWGRNLSDSGAIAAAQAQGAEPRFTLSYAENDTEQLNPQVDSRAVAIINNGPQGPTALDRAQSVIAVGKHMSEAMNKLEGMNEPLIAEANQVAELHKYKPIWPGILRMIHSALPRDPDLNEAMKKGPQAYKELVESNPDAYARSKRKQVFIDRFSSEFSPDVLNEFRALKAARQAQVRSGGGAGNRPDQSAAGQAEGQQMAGYVVTLIGRTPNAEGYEFIRKNLLSDLEKAKDGKEASVAEVYLVDIYQRSKSNRSGGMQDRPMPRYMGGAGSSEYATTREVKDVDPVTGETLEDDYEFEIILAVTLGEPAAAPAQETAAPAGPVNPFGR